MYLMIHIIIASCGLLASGLAVLAPTSRKIDWSKYAVVLTLISGAILVIKTHSSLQSACLSGLVYTAITAVMIFFASERLKSED